MDLNLIKQKLAEQQRQTSNGGGDGKNLFFRPSVGKETIRVVPSAFNPAFPFSELKMYYGIAGKPFSSPSNWGNPDPIIEFTKQLRNGNDSENWKLAKKLDPKVRIVAPVIVRGREDEGIKLWQFGKEVYQSFLNLAADEEVGDFTDILNGRDIKLTTVGPDVTGTKYNKTTITPSMKTSPLSSDASQVESWTSKQPDPSRVFKSLDYEVIRKRLKDYLMPEGSDDEGTIVSEAPVAFDSDAVTPSTPSQPSVAQDTVKKTNLSQFDDMFAEDDDLPF